MSERSEYAPRPERRGELIAEAMGQMGDFLLTDLDESEAEADREYAALKAYYKNLREQIKARKAEAIANAAAFAGWCTKRLAAAQAIHDPIDYPHGQPVPPPEPEEQAESVAIFGAKDRPPRIRSVVASGDRPPLMLQHPPEPPALRRMHLRESSALSDLATSGVVQLIGVFAFVATIAYAMLPQ